MNLENFQKKWHYVPCSEGEKCWCRMIVTDINSTSMKDCIVGSGAIRLEVAHHIVTLHNTFLENEKQ